ncbi:MAG TPA: hypothetical protein ENJ30_14130 [Desulfobulbaceae bacterium]|nr:hypothetical protein [Desulfobulbaceae bacterium]
MALSADRNTAHKDGELLVLGMGAAQKVYAGSMVAKNAAGYIQPAADAANLVVMGMAEEQVDNAGANGALTVPIRRKKAFLMKNSSANAVTVAHIGGSVYIEDDETVASAGGTNSIVAGTCLGVESAGVWVEIG